jgi:hypothetical protein
MMAVPGMLLALMHQLMLLGCLDSPLMVEVQTADAFQLGFGCTIWLL